MENNMKEGQRILLVEDEPNLGTVLKNYLELSGFQVEWRQNGKQGWSAFKSYPFDLCILDVMMPEMDGFTLGKEIRKQDEAVPLIFVTARSQKQDVIKGYLTGADDYITKPFDSELLIHKINALLRRNSNEPKQSDEYSIGQYQYKVKLRLLGHAKEDKRLSPKEAELLALLCEYQNKVMPREKALKQIWKEDSYFTARSMDVYITKLRKYLAFDSDVEIVNYHSSGYMLKTL